MKKILAFVLSLVFSLSALCGGTMAEDVDVTGEWYGDLFGMVMTLTLTDDTYSLDLAGETDEGAYSFDGATLYLDEGTDEETQISYDAQRNVLVLDMGDDMIIEFGREPIAAFVPAPARVDAAIEEFAGEWTATQVNAFDLVAPVDLLELYMDAKIEGTAVTMSINLMGDVEEFTLEGTLTEGVLTMVQLDDEDITYSMQLLEDGTLSTTFEMFGDTVIFYMEPVVSAETAE